VYEPKKTEEDIVSLAIADPSQLDIKELLYAASLIEDNSIKKTIYNTVSKSFPNDYRAYNNLAGIYIKEKNMNKAIDMLGKASKYNANAPEVNENKGIIAALEGDYDKAASLYSSSNASDINKGILAIKTGDYSSATAKLKGNGFNATLAKLMNGNPVATTDNTAEGNYLNAIVNARTGNYDKCIDYLSKHRPEWDANLKNEAVRDFEFKNLKDKANFQALVN
ncbi:MAG: tetratricopeptide repeat protein, partial [Flavobacteriales bacterium]